MTNEIHSIEAALERRFARIAVPPCPERAWQPAPSERALKPLRTFLLRRFSYVGALLALVAVGGIGAHAQTTIAGGYQQFMDRFFVSTAPMRPGIHVADQLTIEQAQQRMPFPIVIPSGLPAGTHFRYAHIISERPVARVVLTYEAHIAARYYRIGIGESTVAVPHRAARLEMVTRTGAMHIWYFPEPLRWKHGTVAMDLFAWGLPAAMRDEIVRANSK